MHHPVNNCSKQSMKCIRYNNVMTTKFKRISQIEGKFFLNVGTPVNTLWYLKSYKNHKNVINLSKTGGFIDILMRQFPLGM